MMRRHHLTLFAFAGALSWALACSDAAAPELGLLTGRPPIPSTPPAPPPSSFYVFALGPSDQSIPVDDSLSVQGYVYGSGPGIDSLDWAVSDTTIASFSVMSNNRIAIHARRPGEVDISARSAALSLTAVTKLTILRRSSQPAPVEVVEFSVVDFGFLGSSDRGYVPQLTLRALGQDSVRIAGVTVDIPGIGPSGYCSAGPPQSVGKSARSMMAPFGDGNMTAIMRKGQSRSPIGSPAVARITVLMNDGTAAQLVVSGNIEIATRSPGYDEVDGQFLSCN